MVASRRAAMRRASPTFLSGIRAALTVLSMALSGVLAAMAVASIHMARRVVTPAARMPDTTILDLDTAAQTITLARTPDTQLPGRYGLFTTGSATYVKLGSVLAEQETQVTRKLLTHIAADAHLQPRAAFSGWYFDSPDQLHLPYTPELIGTSVGPCPAWLFPAGDGDVWVIQIHGRGTTRAEGLRAVPLFAAAGISSLLVSYRNDSEAPRSRSGTYALGATEWRDVDAAIGFARRRGANRIVLMGWSMGGAIALQVSLNSAHREHIIGLILESPVVDWRLVLEYQSAALNVPTAVSNLAIGALSTPWASPITRSGGAIPFDKLDILSRASELQHPILILHSDDDGFVPSDASHDLAILRPDLVDLVVFDVARHTKLWNYDQERWTSSINEWLSRHAK
ncbi:alpha/beta hydrolase family protein [Microbacterium marmarense]|uniref:Alpha/beta fold hydrolase n=1 Tax=Microbacterium marmarense TaxID=3122051 RepID=A0ABU8LTB8_9MICO